MKTKKYPTKIKAKMKAYLLRDDYKKVKVQGRKGAYYVEYSQNRHRKTKR